MIHVDRNSVRRKGNIQIVAGPEELTSDCCMISSRSDTTDFRLSKVDVSRVQG